MHTILLGYVIIFGTFGLIGSIPGSSIRKESSLYKPLIPDIHNVESAFEILDEVEAGDAIKIECRNDLTFNNSLYIQWNDSNSKPLKDVTQLFRNETADHRVITISMLSSDVELYVYCWDPVTRNVLRSFMLQQKTYDRLFQTKTSTCLIHADYWTILSCHDMFIPPSKADQCIWSYTPFGQKESSSRTPALDVLVLGGDVFPAEEGSYVCRCSPTTMKYLLMNFTVTRTDQDNGRDVGNYHFCRHLRKDYVLPTPASLSNGTSDSTHYPGKSPEMSTQCLTVVIILIVLLVLLFLAVLLMWFCLVKPRLRELAPTDTQNRENDTEIENLNPD